MTEDKMKAMIDSFFEEVAWAPMYLRLMVQAGAGDGKTVTSLLIAEGIRRSRRLDAPICVLECCPGESVQAAREAGVRIVRSPVGRFRSGVTWGSKEPEVESDVDIRVVTRALREAAQRFPIVVLDGGQKMAAATADMATMMRKGGNSISGWGAVRPYEAAFADAVASANADVILNFTDRAPIDPKTGEVRPREAYAPKDIEGLVDFVLAVDSEHNGLFTKSRATVLDGQDFALPGLSVGRTLAEYLMTGVVPGGDPIIARMLGSVGLTQPQVDTYLTERGKADISSRAPIIARQTAAWAVANAALIRAKLKAPAAPSGPVESHSDENPTEDAA